MRVRCPHCSQPIELVPDVESHSIVCPSCGSEVAFLSPDEPTATVPLTDMPVMEHFELIEEVGMGQFGRVWKARDLELHRVVAIKVPHKRPLSRRETSFFLREARAAAKLSHPNIVTVFEVGLADDHMYIVSEFIDGPTMRLWRDLRKPTHADTARVCMKVARALDYAHNEGIVHRDLKPSNIILDDMGEPHLTDFGLAKQEGAEATIAITGHVIGTPAYMSPEQIRDGHRVDRRGDVYSLGIILYELITGRRPFRGGRRILFQQVLYDDPEPLRSLNPAVPRDLQTICLKALEKSPERRYQSAADLADDLERFLNGDTITAKPTPTVVRAARWARRRPAIVSSAVLALLVLLLLPFALFKPKALPPKVIAPEVAGPVVRITTEPPGARVLLVPLSQDTGLPQPRRSISLGTSPTQRKIRPGTYLVVAYTPDHKRFHEVYRQVPDSPGQASSAYPPRVWKTNKQGVIHLRPIQLFSQEKVLANMVEVTGGEFIGREASLSGTQRIAVPDFFVDPTETSYAMAQAAGVDLSDRIADHNITELDDPIVELPWGYAAWLAERMGKRLLTNAEFEYLETAGGTQRDPSFWNPKLPSFPNRVHDERWDRLEWDRLSGPIIGLRSHVLEWAGTWTPQEPGAVLARRIVRGGIHGSTDPMRIPPRPISRPSVSGSPDVGFRCARSAKPRTRPADFVQYTPAPRHPRAQPSKKVAR